MKQFSTFSEMRLRGCKSSWIESAGMGPYENILFSCVSLNQNFQLGNHGDSEAKADSSQRPGLLVALAAWQWEAKADSSQETGTLGN